MKKSIFIYFLIYSCILSGLFIGMITTNQNALFISDKTDTLNSVQLNSLGWSNYEIISDSKPPWNDGASSAPDIAVDSSGTVHVVWNDDTDGWWETDIEIMYSSYTPSSGWSNPTIVSDTATLWNNESSYLPSIAVGASGTIHIVWYDQTDGWWGTDNEIMYRNYTPNVGWSSPKIISDDITQWNNGSSYCPDIAVDPSGNVHVVWYDGTDGWWGIDTEIMYTNYSPSSGWSSPIVISDDASLWNNGSSYIPSIVADSSGKIHVVWHDNTKGWWGTDFEIMYTCYTPGSGWTSPIVISDTVTVWNNGYSYFPVIAADNSGNLYVVWQDSTDGGWGTDDEIMFNSYTPSSGWGTPSVISDTGTNWNNDSSSDPRIAVDTSGIVHVVWNDMTEGWWGTDDEIMYRNYSVSTGWNTITILSDNQTKWNDKESFSPSIAVDSSNKVHIVWSDETDGWWGTDTEIMYLSYTPPPAPSTGIPSFSLLYSFMAMVLLGILMSLIKFRKHL
ncbi:MAG: hypothetical protein ACTSYB_14065 [Candidatus Helarchaeota archaeon]